MTNPYILLGLIVFWMVSVTGAYFKGVQHAEDKAKAEYSKQLEDTIQQHNADALVDMEAARAAGILDAKAKTRTVTITNEVERVIHDNPAPAACRITDDTFRLLQSAIQVANGDPDSTKLLPQSGTGLKPPR